MHCIDAQPNADHISDKWLGTSMQSTLLRFHPYGVIVSVSMASVEGVKTGNKL